MHVSDILILGACGLLALLSVLALAWLLFMTVRLYFSTIVGMIFKHNHCWHTFGLIRAHRIAKLLAEIKSLQTTRGNNLFYASEAHRFYRELKKNKCDVNIYSFNGTKETFLIMLREDSIDIMDRSTTTVMEDSRGLIVQNYLRTT